MARRYGCPISKVRNWCSISIRRIPPAAARPRPVPYRALRKQGYAVVGVSVQDAKSHQKFIEKNQLPFPLIADTENRLVQEFGVWGEKSMYGRKYMGTFRTTFIINEEGIIEKVFLPKEIKTKTHAEQILELLA